MPRKTSPSDPMASPAPGGGLSRRQLMGLLGSGVVAAPMLASGGLLATAQPARASLRTNARIVIAGAGAAGISAASRLSHLLDGARITIVDGKEIHNYQPGYTLVGTGVWDESKVIDRNERYLPRDVRWVKAMVAEFDPDDNAIVTSAGERIEYDYLIVATGLQLDYDRIDGMSTDLIGRDGVGSVYAGSSYAKATWETIARFRDQGGVGLFGRPGGDIKCAGAPVKVAFMTEDRLRQAGTRNRAELHYFAQNDTLFGVPSINTEVVRHFAEKNIQAHHFHILEAIDPGAKRATYRTPDGPVEMGYDFIHVVPPMSAPDSLKNSPLPWQEGNFAADGWLEVDRATLQHPRYPNVFGIGDINGVPRGKTAASVKAQTPVATHNLVQAIAGREPDAVYNGYTSCPLITSIGQAMLVEFDYAGNLTPSFGFIDPLRPHWVSWVLKDKFLRPAYYAMLRGRI